MDALALAALVRMHRWLRPYYRNPAETTAAQEMAAAASMAGMAFVTAFTTVCHGLSFPVAEHLELSHGRACAVLMAPVAQANASIERPEIETMRHVLEISSRSELPAYLQRLRADLDDKDTLSSLGMGAVASDEMLQLILDHAHRPMLDNNRLPLDRPGLQAILQHAG